MKLYQTLQEGSKLLGKATTSCFGWLIENTRQYQDRTSRIETRFNQRLQGMQETSSSLQVRLAKAEEETNSANERVKFHAQRALDYQTTAESRDPAKLIPGYDELVRKLEKTKLPFMILSPDTNTILYVSKNLPRKNSQQLKGTNYKTLLDNASYLTERFNSDRMIIGGQVYQQKKIVEVHGFKVVNMEHIKSLEDIAKSLLKATERITQNLRPRLKRS